MREIKFRGLSIETGEWVYGSLSMVNTNSQKIGANAHGQMFICNAQTRWQNLDNGKTFIGDWTEVDAKSVGQFTGLKDKNGVDIYEGDILLNEGNSEHTKKEYLNQRFTVTFNDLYAKFECKAHNPMPDNTIFMPHIYICEIIGNIHQNPEIPCK